MIHLYPMAAPGVKELRKANENTSFYLPFNPFTPKAAMRYRWVIWRLQSSAPLRRFAAQWSRRTGVSDQSVFWSQVLQD